MYHKIGFQFTNVTGVNQSLLGNNIYTYAKLSGICKTLLYATENRKDNLDTILLPISKFAKLYIKNFQRKSLRS